MSYTKRKLEDLNVMDDFIISAVAADETVGVPFCRTVLSVLLQREIGNIKVSAQRFISASTPSLRGIRMDVEIIESKDATCDSPALNIYDLEPHLTATTKLERHNRFYQAKIDGKYVKSGEKDFGKMPNLYVLTITDFDPFGYDYMMYTVRNQCVEVPELSYNDGLQFIYFYTGGSKGGSPEIRTLLTYFQNSIAENATNEATRRIHDYVSQVKVSPEARLEYMRFEDIIQREREDAAEEAAAKAAEEAAAEATQRTKVQSILELLEDHGTIPDSLKEQLDKEENTEILKNWHKLAARVDSIEEFIEKM